MKISRKIMFVIFISVAITALIFTIFSLNQLYDTKKNAVDTLNQEYTELYDYNINTAEKETEERISWVLEKLLDDFNHRISFVESSLSFVKDYLEQIYSEDIYIEYDEFDEWDFMLRDGVDYYDIQDELTSLEGAQSVFNGLKDQNVPGDIYYSTETGITIFSDSYGEYHQKNGSDAREKDWYKEAVKKQGVYWSEIYLDGVSGNQVLTCSMPVYDKNGNIKGVVGVNISVNEFLEEIIDDAEDIDEYTFMMKQDGTFLIGSYGKDINKLLDEEEFKCVYDYINNSIGSTVVINDKYMISGLVTEESDLFLGVLISIEELYEHAKNIGDYILYTNVKIEDSINSKTGMLFIASSIIFVFSIVVSVIISGRLAKSIVKPLNILMDGAQKIGAGNLYHKIEVNTNDELNDLANSFNNMTEMLNKYIKELTAVMLEKERLETELDVARKIQVSMLPTKFPGREEFDIIANMYPARKVGGDFYDFFFIDEEHLAFDIADVSGKGVPAALFMAKAKTLIKDNLLATIDPAKALFKANNLLCEDNKEDMFVTAFVAVLNIKTGELVYANAGHNSPLVYSKKDKEYKYIKPKANFILAVMNNVNYKNESITLKRGEKIFCYTDGVTEAMDANNNLYSEERLIETLNGYDIQNKSIQEVLDYVKEDIDKFSDGVQQSDDITMLSIEVK